MKNWIHPEAGTIILLIMWALPGSIRVAGSALSQGCVHCFSRIEPITAIRGMIHMRNQLPGEKQGT
jgi:hypothetical protein